MVILDGSKYICHGRKFNLVEFQILPVETPIGLSTKIKLIEIYERYCKYHGRMAYLTDLSC